MKIYTGTKSKLYTRDVCKLHKLCQDRIWFRNNSENLNLVFYYRSEPFVFKKKGERNTNIVYLNKRNITFEAGKHHLFYELAEAEHGTEFYSGKALQNIIAEELYHWACNMNLETLRCFKGRQLENYLRGIPCQVFVDAEDVVRQSFSEGLLLRARGARNKEEFAKVSNAIDRAFATFDQVAEEKHQELKRETENSFDKQIKEIQRRWL